MKRNAADAAGKILIFIFILFLVMGLSATAQGTVVDAATMQAIYDEVRTPYKFGVVIYRDSVLNRNIDCPTVFRYGDYWYMVYVQSEVSPSGYSTQLARSRNLWEWERLGTILPQGDSGEWDYANAAGGVALANTEWGGTGELGTFEGKYWLSYFGGAIPGYESAPLSISRASTTDPSALVHWTRDSSPMLTVNDPDTGDWEDYTLYKSYIMEDPDRTLGSDGRFLIYYNAKGSESGSEYIGLATSPDMRNWTRYTNNPVIVNGSISGDPQIVKIGDVWVMFYYGAFWNAYPENTSAAFDTFACSHDLVNWTQWDGLNLVDTTTYYDSTFAHKPWIIKYNGVVYHFYCAVGSYGRVIALATSKDLRQDYVAPTPNPMTWASVPTTISDSSITMTAAVATDTFGVEYYFTNVTDSSHDSGWQDSNIYTDTGLLPDASYTYTVKARDMSSRQNTTGVSSSKSATTYADSTPPVPNPMTWAVAPYPVNNSSISMTATTAGDPSEAEYYFENMTFSDGSHDSGWVASPFWTDTALEPGTAYSYKVKAKDSSPNANETDWSDETSAMTDPWTCTIPIEIDLSGDCQVNMIDFVTLALHWPVEPTALPVETLVNGGFDSVLSPWNMHELSSAYGIMAVAVDAEEGNPPGSALIEVNTAGKFTNDHRFYQVIPVNVGYEYVFSGQWAGDISGVGATNSNPLNWAEVYIGFTDTSTPGDSDFGNLVYKKSYGTSNLNTSTGIWNWESITDSSYDGGPQGSVFAATAPYMCVSFNLGGRANSGTTYCRLENLSVMEITPCPEIDLNDDCELNLEDLELLLDEDWLTCNRDPFSECWL